MTPKIFYPVGGAVIEGNLNTTKSLESSSEEEPDTITLLFRFPVCSSSPTYRLFFSFHPTHIKPWLASCSRYGVTNFTLFVILPVILGR